MSHMSPFEISASGMTVERARLDATAINLANLNTTRTAGGAVYRPLRVISGPKGGAAFSETMDLLSPGVNGAQKLNGVEVSEIRQLDVSPRLVYEPAHPDADAKGFVSYPGINPVQEMVNLISTLRAYEANVVAMNAAKVMALKALDIGGNG